MINYTKFDLKNPQERKLLTASFLVPRLATLTLLPLLGQEGHPKVGNLRFRLGHDNSGKQQCVLIKILVSHGNTPKGRTQHDTLLDATDVENSLNSLLGHT